MADDVFPADFERCEVRREAEKECHPKCLKEYEAYKGLFSFENEFASAFVRACFFLVSRFFLQDSRTRALS